MALNNTGNQQATGPRIEAVSCMCMVPLLDEFEDIEVAGMDRWPNCA